MKSRIILMTLAICSFWFILGFVGCAPEEPLPKNVVVIGGVRYELVEYDGCEYLHRTEIYNRILTHKGNCKNPIHGHNR